MTLDEQLEVLAEYCANGRRRALELGKRGPVRFVGDRVLHPEIVKAYWRTGFYVFEGLIESDELADLRPVSYMKRTIRGLGDERDRFLLVGTRRRLID